MTHRRAVVLLWLTGLVLMLLQGLLIRELSAAFISCEVTILVVTLGYWSGMALGYALAGRLAPAHRTGLAALTLLMQYALIVVRLWPMVGLWLGLRGWWAMSWVYLLAVPLPLCYSLLLPHMVAQRAVRGLSEAYRLEVLGALAGLGLWLSLSLVAGPWLWWSYFAAVTALTWWLAEARWLRAAAVLALAVYLPCATSANRWQSGVFYAVLKHVPIRTWLHASDSPYQKVELFEGQDGTIRCFLNGMEYFNTRQLERFNLLLSGLPARLMSPTQVLIIGSGSMSSVAHLRSAAERITTVELDRRVYDVNRRHLAGVNRLDETPQHRVVIDDAKHFLRATTDRFDLIVVDVPAPFYIQTGVLFTQEFYELLRSRLRPGGAVSLYASGWFVEGNPVSRQVTAGVAAVFPQWYVLSEFSLGATFVLAGDELPFDQRAIAEAVRGLLPENEDVWIYPPAEALAQVVKGAKPLSLHRPLAILQLNGWMLQQLWNPGAVALPGGERAS